MFNFFRNKNKKQIDRLFEPKYLINEELHKYYIENGFCIIKNIVDDSIIDDMLLVYNEIKRDKEYTINNDFLNSGRLTSSVIRNRVVGNIKGAAKKILPLFVDISFASIENGGAFQIKPPSKESMLNPHQDTPIIDETKFYATYVWIPLHDVDVNNGCLSVIPRSHLWGNHQRSLNIPWIYDKEVKSLWKKMIDLPIQKGDIICFDPALIHGSGKNKTNKERLAIQISAIPNNETLITVIEENRLFSKAKFYQIDENYFTEESVIQHPSAKYPVVKEQNMNYYYSKESIFKLLNHTNS